MGKELSDSEFFKRLFDGYHEKISKNEDHAEFENWLDDNDETLEESFDQSRKEKAKKRFKKRMKKNQ